MIKKYFLIIILLTASIVSNAFSENRLSFNIPDSPATYSFNTWDENNWTEVEVRHDAFVIEWSSAYLGNR